MRSRLSSHRNSTLRYHSTHNATQSLGAGQNGFKKLTLSRCCAQLQNTFGASCTQTNTGLEQPRRPTSVRSEIFAGDAFSPYADTLPAKREGIRNYKGSVDLYIRPPRGYAPICLVAANQVAIIRAGNPSFSRPE